MVRDLRKITMLAISLIFMLLVGCSPGEEDILKKTEKTFNKIGEYECLLNIKIDMEDNNSQYRMKETYKGSSSLVEIVDPEESRGITLEYLEDKIIIENSSIEQSITLGRIKTLDKGFLIQDIIENIRDFNFIEERIQDGKKYYAFQYILEDSNKYNYEKILLLDKKSLVPFSLEILDKDGSSHTTIFYESFKNLS